MSSELTQLFDAGGELWSEGFLRLDSELAAVTIKIKETGKAETETAVQLLVGLSARISGLVHALPASLSVSLSLCLAHA